MNIVGEFASRGQRTYELFAEVTDEIKGKQSRSRYQIHAHAPGGPIQFTNTETGEQHTVHKNPRGGYSCECWGYLRWRRCKHSGLAADLAAKLHNHTHEETP